MINVTKSYNLLFVFNTITVFACVTVVSFCDGCELKCDGREKLGTVGTKVQ